jgi:hypothetical protein
LDKRILSNSGTCTSWQNRGLYKPDGGGKKGKDFGEKGVAENARNADNTEKI